MLFATLAVGLPCFAQSRELLSHFDYDKSAPIGMKTIGTEKCGYVSIYDITYASPKGGVVPAYLVVPKGNGPFCWRRLGSLVLGELSDAQPERVF